MAAATAVLVLTAPAQARDVADVTVSENETVVNTYPSIPGNQPPVLIGGVTGTTPNDCRGANYCDLVDININVPASYTNADFFRINIELAWTESTPNNLNMALWNTSNQQLASAATTNNPERLHLQDPPSKKYFLCISNVSGINAGYTLKVTFVAQGRIAPIESPPEATRAKEQPPPVFAFGQDDSLRSIEQPDSAPAGTGPRAVEKPGDDGPLASRVLSLVASVTAASGSSKLPVVLTSIVAAVLTVAFGIVLYRRGRMDDEDA